MSSVLQKYFPMIRTREAILQEITTTPNLYSAFQKWDKDQQDAFLAYCTGQKGLHILHDPVFKEILNPELSPGRVEELLSLILGEHIKILHILPLESPRIGDEHSLIVMDLVVKLETGSIVNIEVQKLGYRFPGQRSACYSADLLLRQYKRMRNEKSKSFSYKDIKKVYTIVLYEKSTSEFHQFPENYIHRFSQQSDTGISIDLLQEYVFIPLDIFYRILHNKGIRNQLNTERLMDMFSKELQELDKNTVQYMIDEMQEEIDAQKETIDKQELLLNEKEQSLITSQKTIKEQEEEIQKLKELLNELSSR